MKMIEFDSVSGLMNTYNFCETLLRKTCPRAELALVEMKVGSGGEQELNRRSIKFQNPFSDFP